MPKMSRLHEVRRVLYSFEKELPLDQDGLLEGDDEQFRRIMGLRSIEDLLEEKKTSRVLVLAEAGMGKSVLMRALRDTLPPSVPCFLDLGEFVGDGGGLATAVQRHFELAEAPFFIIDGLDEAPEFVGLLARELRKPPKDCKIWMASRPVPEVQHFLERMGSEEGGQAEFLCMALAPLSEDDVAKMARASFGDEGPFLMEVRKHGLLPICATPLGCEQMLMIYKEQGGLGAMSPFEVFSKSVRSLCDEMDKKKKSKHPLDHIIGCAAWICTCLSLSGRKTVWVTRESEAPDTTLTFSHLHVEKFPLDLLEQTVRRGIFRPSSIGISLAHARYRDFLAACGFAEFIGRQHWETLLLREDRRGLLPTRAGVAGFLAELDTPFREGLLNVAPEALLASDGLVQSVGAGVLCQKLFERAAEMSYRQRHSTSVRSNLWRLKGRDTTDLVCRVLADPNAGEAEYDLAILIATKCACEEASRDLIDRALNKDLALQDRVRAASAAADIGNQAANVRLKALLPLDQAEDVDDDLRGAVLQCLWPEHLTVEELTQHLVRPNRKMRFHHYQDFLRTTLPKTFHEHMDEDNAHYLLAWAVRHLDTGDDEYIFRRLIGQVFVFCWQWASRPPYTALFAEGFRASAKRFRPLFHTEEGAAHDGAGLMMTSDVYLSDSVGRLDVLMDLLRVSDDIHSLWWILDGSFPLIWEGDMEALLEHALGEDDPRMLAGLRDCLRAILPKVDLEKYGDKIQRAHEHSRGVIPSADALKDEQEEARKRLKRLNQEQESAARRRESGERQRENGLFVRLIGLLNVTEASSDHFCKIAWSMFSDGSGIIMDHLDLGLCKRGKRLTADDWNRVVFFAESFLNHEDDDARFFHERRYFVVQALLLLHRHGKGIEFSDDVWRRLIVPALSVLMGTTREGGGDLLEGVSQRYPRIIEDGIVSTLLQEESPGWCTQMLRSWGSRLTDGQAERLLAASKGSDCVSERGYAILRGLLECGQQARVGKCLNQLLDDKWQPHPDAEWAKHLLLALEIFPETCAERILDAASADPSWGRSWIETAVDADERGIGRHFIACGSGCVGRLLIWLRRNYPPEQAPQHDGVHLVQTLDRVYWLQNGLVSHLVESGQDGAAAALDRVSREFPAERWVGNAVLDARAEEQSKRAGFLSPEQIKKLCGSGTSLVQTIRDLHDLVLRKLDEYQAYLQEDTRALNDLWDTHKPRPKKEEDVSDHLKRYLDLVLPPGTVVNREVQIRRKLFLGGDPGSRTDVWVQALDPESTQILTLCIEVKCNWNQEGKDALRAQLLEKYMMRGGAGAGILLLCWFDCPKWDGGDSRKNKRLSVWPDIETARSALEAQAEAERQKGPLISAVVIDCSLA